MAIGIKNHTRKNIIDTVFRESNRKRCNDYVGVYKDWLLTPQDTPHKVFYNWHIYHKNNKNCGKELTKE